METFPSLEPNAALVVGPDDVLVIGMPAGVERSDVDRLRDEIVREHPHLGIIIVGGDIQLAVIRGGSGASAA